MSVANFSVDKVHLVQDFGGGLPLAGSAIAETVQLPVLGSERGRHQSRAAGAVTRRVFGTTHDFPGGGSFDFWSDGRYQSVRFNPALLGRSHSLECFQDFGALVELANQCAAVVGDRPRFTPGERFRVVDSESGAVRVSYSGAHLTRLDVCQLLSAGDALSARGAINALSSLKRGRDANEFTRGESVTWHSTSRVAKVRMYVKAPELRENSPDCPAEVVEWCEANGIVRHEVELLRRRLKADALDLPQAWDGSRAEAVLDEFSYFSPEVLSVKIFTEIYERALALGWSKGRAARAERFAFAWSAGENVRSRGSSRTVSAARADLLRFGFDIYGVYDAEASAAVNRPVSLCRTRFSSSRQADLLEAAQ